MDPLHLNESHPPRHQLHRLSSLGHLPRHLSPLRLNRHLPLLLLVHLLAFLSRRKMGLPPLGQLGPPDLVQTQIRWFLID